MYKTIFTVTMVLLCLKSMLAQDYNTIQLLDKTTKTPIIDATISYAQNQGISNIDGEIQIQIDTVNTLYLSHINYGNWQLNPAEIKAAIQSGAILRKQEIFTVQPVTVIAMRPRMANRKYFSLNTIDKLAHDAASILNQTPVINSIRKSGGYGFDPVLRGFKYDQLNVVIDGIQGAIAACPNRMDPPTSQVSPNMMESVEIFKGPHSFRYGTAFGGTVNFKSGASRFSEKQNIYGRISSSSESNGGIFRSEGMFGISNANYNWTLFGSWSQGNDYKDGDDMSVPARFERMSLGSSLGLKLTDKMNLTLSVTHNVADQTDFAALPMDLVSDQTTLLNARYSVSFNSKHLKYWNTTIYSTLVNHKMDNLSKKLNPRTMNATTNAKTYSYGGRSEGIWFVANGKLYVGFDFKIDKADGTRKREFLIGPMMGKTVFDNVWNGGQITKTGVFAEYHHKLAGLQMIYSSRLENNKSEATDLNEYFAAKNSITHKTLINPSLSIGGSKDLRNGFSLGLWLGHAQRSPSITERYINSFPVGLDPYDMLGNPVLKPEINNQVDISVDFSSNNTTLDLSLFTSFLSEYISSQIDTSLSATMPSSPGVRRYVNVKAAIITGFEFSWQQYLFAGLNHNLNMAFTYGEDRVRKEPLPEIAPLDIRYTLNGHFLENKVNPMLSFRYVLQQDRISRKFGETKTPSFSLLDLGISYQMLDYLKTTVGIKNVFDQAYYEHLSRSVRGTNRNIYAMGRSFYLTIAFDFS
jgi:iron complex outermembrane recepter protein